MERYGYMRKLGKNDPSAAGPSGNPSGGLRGSAGTARHEARKRRITVAATAAITLVTVSVTIAAAGSLTGSFDFSARGKDMASITAARRGASGNAGTAQRGAQDGSRPSGSPGQGWRSGGTAGSPQGSEGSLKGNNNSGSHPQDTPSRVASSIPGNAVVISRSMAATPDGTVYDIATGATVSDSQDPGQYSRYFGTDTAPADPLAKTGGKSFLPVPVEDIRDKAGSDAPAELSSGRQQGSTAPAGASVSLKSQDAAAAAPLLRSALSTAPLPDKALPAALQNNSYGAHWGQYNGTPAFFSRNGYLFAQQAKGVIDVSEWQKNIDWAAAKRAGVEGAIIRIGYGVGNADKKAQYNISECKRLGIPFGVYIYSYASDSGFAYNEGASTANLLKRFGVSERDLSYPIYYDLEAWTWKGHTRSTDPAVYEKIVSSWYSAMGAAGYGNKLSVYSYTSYLNSALNRPSIYQKTSWVAQYGSTMTFTGLSSNFRGWQYASDGRINGISGNVDINAFGYKDAVRPASTGLDVTRLPQVTVPNGLYYINVRQNDTMSVDINKGSLSNGQALQLYHWNNATAQQFRFTRQNDGSYVITNVNSGKAIDVSGSRTYNNAKIQQWEVNGAAAQKWFIRDAGNGCYLQSALGNWVLDMTNGSSANFTPVKLYTPNGLEAQKFQIASVNPISTGTAMRISSGISSGLVMDIPSGSRDNFARPQLYTWNGGSAQLFTFRQVGNSVYTIANLNSGKLVDVDKNRSANGSMVQQYQSTGNEAQHWHARWLGGNRYGFIGSGSGKFLDDPAGNTALGTKLQIWQDTKATAQQWEVAHADSPAALAYQHRNDLADGVYTFGAAADPYYRLDLNGGSSANGTNIQLWQANGVTAQDWKVNHDAEGFITFTSVASGKALDVAGSSTQRGANVQQWPLNGAAAQKWVAVRNSNGTYTFISALDTSRALDIPNGIARNYANVQIWETNGAPAQQWRAYRK